MTFLVANELVFYRSIIFLGFFRSGERKMHNSIEFFFFFFFFFNIKSKSLIAPHLVIFVLLGDPRPRVELYMGI